MKQDVIVETEGQFPKKVCFSIWGDKINVSQLQIGNKLKIEFDIESREYKGKWFTDIKAWKIELIGSGTPKTYKIDKETESSEVDDDEDYANFISILNGDDNDGPLLEEDEEPAY